jgi:hypothetical protein
VLSDLYVEIVRESIKRRSVPDVWPIDADRWFVANDEMCDWIAAENKAGRAPLIPYREGLDVPHFFLAGVPVTMADGD